MRKLKYLGLFIGFILIQMVNMNTCFAQKDLYLLIGQSNMAGRAPILTRDTLTLKNVYLFDGKGKWVPASNPLNRYSGIRKKMSMQKLGPGYSFAQTLANKLPGHTIYLVVNAHGGSSISEWQKGRPYYENSLKRIKHAMNAANLKAIIWHQGESDSGNTNSYMKKLKQMVNDFRKDLNRPDLPFIAGETGRWEPSHKNINAVIDTIPSEINNSAVVSSKGLTHIKSKTNPHFNEKSQLIFGQRYAMVVLQLIYDK